MKAVVEVYKRMTDFEGRSSVLDFLIFGVYFIVVSVGLIWVDLSNGWFQQDVGMGPCFGVFVVLNILPNLALAVRRLHDLDLSGWWYLINFIPFLGAFILLIMLLWPGMPGNNRFGPRPSRRW